jgi:hypothetical protein
MSNLCFVLKSINPLQLIYLILLKRLLFTLPSTTKEWDWSVLCTERSRRNIPSVSLFPFGHIWTSNPQTFSEPVLALPSENHASSNSIILFVFFLRFAWLPSTWLLLVIAVLTCFQPTVFGKCVPFGFTFWPSSNLAGNSFHASPVSFLKLWLANYRRTVRAPLPLLRWCDRGMSDRYQSPPTWLSRTSQCDAGMWDETRRSFHGVN